jgi:outer membrane protein assembly factor BamB
MAVDMTVVAAVFVAAVVVLLAWNYTQRLVKEPLEAESYRALKFQLADLKKREQTPEIRQQIDATLEEIRGADLQLRQQYFRERRFTARGAILLMLGLIVLAGSAKTVAVLRRRLPMPTPQVTPRDVDAETGRLGRRSVAALGAVLAVGAMALMFAVPTALTGGNATEVAVQIPSPEQGGPQGDAPKIAPQKGETKNAGEGKTPAPIGPAPSKDEIAKNWPRFRGPGGLGVSPYSNAPIKWDVASGEGIVWKTPVPLPGNSSPILWKDRIFLTGGEEGKHVVYAFDAASGKLLWEKEAPSTPASQAKLEIMEDTGPAASTPVTDGRLVAAIFANGDVAAFDFDGKLAWSRSLGIPKNSYGHAASLEIAGGRVLVQMDQGTAKEKLSKLMALDLSNGATAWEVKREMPSSWATPLAFEAGGREQILTCGDPWAIAYAPADGKELWRAKCLRQDVGPSPVFAEGMVYVVNTAPQASAIRPDGQGDVTASHIAWSGEDGLPDTSSPLVASGMLILLTSSGTVTAYDAKAGKKLWEKDFESTFQASPCMAGKYLYLFGSEEEGKTWVAEPTPTGCNAVFETTMHEKCSASPAFADGRMFVRTKGNLYCIGAK